MFFSKFFSSFKFFFFTVLYLRFWPISHVRPVFPRFFSFSSVRHLWISHTATNMTFCGFSWPFACMFARGDYRFASPFFVLKVVFSV